MMPSTGPPASILAVSDDASQRKLVRVLLEADGHRVEEAHDAACALARLESGKFALVIADERIGVTDGLALATAVRALPGQERTVILLLAPYLTWEREARAQASGCDGWLNQPIETRLFVSQVDKWLQRGRRFWWSS